jgi:glycosyltransferase involved in cell wall biosynthesis
VSGAELITDGVDGILIEPSDIEQLAHAMQRLITDKDYAAKIGEAGREKILSTFMLDKVMPQNVAFYQNAINRFKSE